MICKHLHKKIVPMEHHSMVFCTICSKKLDEFKGGIFEN
jgi:predicted metal-binding protein